MTTYAEITAPRKICGERHPYIADCFGCQEKPGHRGCHRLNKYPTHEVWADSLGQLQEDLLRLTKSILAEAEKPSSRSVKEYRERIGMVRYLAGEAFKRAEQIDKTPVIE